MDVDMHYYGTYALARSAGLSADVARRIATAAEFVDDSTETGIVVHPDGARFRGEATAHHPTDLRPNNNLDDQMMVWIPFHFLPGNAGNTQSQKLICRKDSELAQKMVEHHLALAEMPFGVELIGITAHVYADTFAHYGFSGVSSRVNRVIPESLKPMNGDPLFVAAAEAFFAKYKIQGGLLRNFRREVLTWSSSKGPFENIRTLTTAIASRAFAYFSGDALGRGALGHGAVATFPDQPFLEWQYSYELIDVSGQPGVVERQNAGDYEQAARALYGVFRKFAAAMPIYTDNTGGLDYDQISSRVSRLVRAGGSREMRIAAWKRAMSDGDFSRGGGEEIPDYDHNEWRQQTAQLGQLKTLQDATAVPVYHFHFAADLHRHYVLRELLPAYGLFVI